MKKRLVSIAALALALQLTPLSAHEAALSVDNAADAHMLTTLGRGMARDVAWVSDEAFLVASATNLWRYDSPTAAPVPLFAEERSRFGVALNPTADLLALCDAEQLTVYDYPALTARYTLATACASAPEALTFSPDGQTLANGDERTLRLWDVQTGESRGAFAQTTRVLTIDFMPDDTIVSRAQDGLLRWWSRRGELVHSVEVPPLPVAVSPNGALLVTPESGEIDGRYQPYVAVTDITSGEILWQLPTASTRYAFVANNGLVTVRDGQLLLWDLTTGEALATVDAPIRQTRQVLPAPDGRQVLVVGATGVAIFDVEAREVTAQLTDHLARVEEIAFSPDGVRLAANTQANLRLWELATQDETIIHDSFVFSSFAFTADGDLLTNGQDAALHRWSVTGEHIEPLGDGFSSNLIALGPDGDTVALSSYSANGSVLLWSLEEERERFPLENEVSDMDEISDIAFSPDGQRIASGTWYGSVSVWNRYGGAEIARLGPYHDGPVEPYVGGLSFSPNSEWLYYTESGVGLIHRWNMRDRAEAEPLRADCSTAIDTAFAPDGRLLAVACDHDILLWDTDGDRLLARLSGHTDQVMAVAFSPDGALLASASWDGTVRLWGLP